VTLAYRAFVVCVGGVCVEGEVRDQIDCQLASGEYLRFGLCKDGRPLSPMGGNYLYVKDQPDGPQVIFAGQTDNLAQNAQSRWAEAKAGYEVDGLYTRLNITTAVRRREHQDLLTALDPPMNTGEPRAAADAGGDKRADRP
jgi:hypothetical protein